MDTGSTLYKRAQASIARAKKKKRKEAAAKAAKTRKETSGLELHLELPAFQAICNLKKFPGFQQFLLTTKLLFLSFIVIQPDESGFLPQLKMNFLFIQIKKLNSSQESLQSKTLL